ncbi:MAG: transcriptional regulator, MarR family [Firmicutes bacterium]|nr:transcriptional regulator, MarR family [Bacillota bacterium]
MLSPEVDLKLKKVFMEMIKTYRESYRGAVLGELELADMTFKQFVYLDTIIKMNNPTYSELGRKFKVTKPAVTAAVNKLIGLGYLERVQSNEDRRVYHVMISDKGKRMLAIEDMAASEYIKHMQTCLTEGEVEQYIAIVEKISACYVSKRS